MMGVSDPKKNGFKENGSQQPQRGADGRFLKGNKGGPGNPFGRAVARFRKKVLESVTEEDIERLVKALVRRATEAGDNQAAKLLLQYVIGKPADARDPDRVEIEEFDQMRETAGLIAEADEVAGVEPDIALAVARTLRQGQTADITEVLMQMVANAEVVDVAVVGEEAPSTNGFSGEPSPSTNGSQNGQQECHRGVSEAFCDGG